jgi:hypothetical protein
LGDCVNTRDARAREIQTSIARVLFEDWDPIGVRHEPGCEGEYDAYVGGVYRVLASAPSLDTVAQHLADIERDQIGLGPASPEKLRPVAEKLLALNVRL